MPTGLHLWSRTAASNATADSSINWAEGQSPSSVNDSARAMMARIGQKNTAPEIAVRRALHGLGARFRLHRRDLPGTPDVVLPGRRLALLIHGCFWHRHAGCRFAYTPKSRLEFWSAKFARNVDHRHVRAGSEGRLLAIVGPDRLERILTRLLDERELLSPHGVRSVSACHREEPFTIDILYGLIDARVRIEG